MRVQWLDIGPAGGVVVALLIVLIGCGVASERGGAFPTFPILAPVNVFEQAEGGEHVTCILETESDAKRVVQSMRERFPDGWKSPSRYVSFAPAYRIVLGTTEILVLKHGLVVSFDAANGGRTLAARELPAGEAESLARTICGKTM